MKNLIICEHQTSKYAIVFSPLQEQSFRAAVMLQSALCKITGASLPILADTDTEPSPYEIIVGLTNRENVTFPYDRRGIGDLGHSISVKEPGHPQRRQLPRRNLCGGCLCQAIPAL